MRISIEGFAGLKELYRSAHSLLLRGQRADGLPVILKTTSDRHPSRALIGEFIREGRLLTKAQGSYVVTLLELREFEGAPVLVFEDFGGGTLLELPLATLGFDQRLRIALELARAIEAVHSRGIIHRDINPANIVCRADATALKLIDFGIASDLERETVGPQHAGTLDGTLHYLAPEQTGRMNRSVDRRSDLYSAGVTLYQLFSGTLPFTGDDPLELVHAHLARPAPPLKQINAEVPESVANIVMRLLAKDPQDRYQTAAGLVADLETSLRQRSGQLPARPFRLGTADNTGSVEIPQRLYGRADEVDALLGAFELAAAGGRELVLIRGAPGIGKTALVREVYQPVAERSGDFLEGKFDQFRLGVPYAPLGAAFGQFLRRVLTQPDHLVAHWAASIGEAIGRNAAVLAPIIPELESLLGPQPPAPQLAAAEAENRLHLAFRELVEAIATRDHPVVLFLDDLQWADMPSLRLLEQWVTDTDCRYLLVIGAYRDTEIDAGHPLTLSIDNCRRGGSQPTDIHLKPLESAQIVRMLRDTFERDDAEVKALAALCEKKTGGNPFFLRRFLVALGERGIARWVATQRRWVWSLEDADNLEHSENVVSFMLDRFRSLPLPAQEAMRHAACIGGVFDLRLLSACMQRTPAQLQADLQPAVRAELIAPRGRGWVLDDNDAPDSMPAQAYAYAFVHDQIHQAAYSALPEASATAAHHRLGRQLIELHRGQPLGAWRFEVVNHLNKAAGLAIAAGERVELATHNLEAGRLAKRAAAFAPAGAYFDAGLRALPDEAWQQHYALALALHIEAAECDYLNARFDQLAGRVASVKRHSRSLLDGIKALEIEMEARLAQDDLLPAVHVALDALAKLGVDLPRAPGDAEVGAAVQRAMTALAGLSIEQIEALPDVDAADVAAAQRILVRASSAAYYVVPSLLPIIACELVVTSVQRGLSPATPFAFAVYGLVLNSIGMMPQAYDYGGLAERLIERWDDRHLEARTRLVVNNHIRSWIAPLHSKLDNLREAYRIGRDTGDFEYAAICAQCYCTNAFSAGRELAALLEECEQFSGFMRNYEQQSILRLHLPLVQLVRSMAGLNPVSASLDGGGFDERETLDFASARGNASLSFVTLSDMLLARFHFGSMQEAYEVAEAARPLQYGAVSTYHLVNFHTFAPLAAATLYGTATDTQRTTLLANVDESIAQLQVWASHGPLNHRHRLLLMQAERARMLGADPDAESLFLQALAAARDTQYVNDEALIAERTARFYIARGGVYRSMARAFLQDALFAYERWGATAKVTRLEAEFPLRLTSDTSRLPSAPQGRPGISVKFDIDAVAVVKSAQAISAEIELDALLVTIFRIMIEAAGAQRALLLLEHRGRWQIAVEGSAAEPERVNKDIDQLDDRQYPLGVLRYVLRTGRDIVIDDASSPGNPMEASHYRARTGARSVLCVPVRHRGTLSALLYLDHSEADGVFTAARCDLLKLLMSQAAVSLNNAQLFEAQKQLTRAQDRFVPHQFLDSLARNNIADVRLGDAITKTMTVCFSDLRNFTTLVEALGGDAVIALLNKYFAAMEPVIAQHGGFIDSFNGDGIMALFDGVPDQAVHAAIQMHAALHRFNLEHGHELQMGIGLSTGPLVLGTVGGRDRIKCGVVGDTVNLAARIESLSKRYGAQLLLGGDTVAALADPGQFSLRLVDRVFVKGMNRAHEIVEVLDAAPAAEQRGKQASRTALANGLACYRQREFGIAAQHFTTAQQLAPGDPVPAIFIARCQRFDTNPPPEHWQDAEWLDAK